MKITTAHYIKLKTEIDLVLKKYPNIVSTYENNDFQLSDNVKNKQRRFCFDLLFAADLSEWVRDELYPYLNDDIIYTALKSICPHLKVKL